MSVLNDTEVGSAKFSGDEYAGVLINSHMRQNPKGKDWESKRYAFTLQTLKLKMSLNLKRPVVKTPLPNLLHQ